MSRALIIHGAGFSYGSDGMWADKYVLNLIEKPDPLCLFLPHATDDATGYVNLFKKYWTNLGARTKSLSLFTPETSDIESYILESDLIYIGGGNTKSMLCL